jgi:hypothetical protein
MYFLILIKNPVYWQVTLWKLMTAYCHKRLVDDENVLIENRAYNFGM